MEFINKHSLIENGDRVLLGVSGGPDSVFMASVLSDLRGEIGFEIGIAVFNHKIRPESKEEADFVKEFAEKIAAPFFYGEEDIGIYAEKKGISLEEAARERRLAFLLKTARENGFNKIALAHNKDDLVETVLYHIIKGSGLDGLIGIKPKSFEGIIHPVLCIERREIESYIEENKIPFRTDKTNFLLSYSRNRIRHQILPLFTSLNPSFKDNIFYMSEILAKENDFLSELSEKDAKTIKDEEGYSLKLFLSLPVFEQRRIIKTMFGENASFERVERVLQFLRDESKNKENFYGNLFVFKKRGKFFIEEQKEPLFTINSVYKLDVPGVVEIEEANFIIESKIVSKFQPEKLGKFSAMFDFEALRFPLFVRFRKEGDKIFTEAGTKKLQDIFVNMKIPYEKRAFVPILVDKDDNILWVVGLRRSALCKVSGETKKILFLSARFKKN